MSDSQDYLKKKTCEPQTGALLLGKVYEKSGLSNGYWSKLKTGLRNLFPPLAGQGTQECRQTHVRGNTCLAGVLRTVAALPGAAARNRSSPRPTAQRIAQIQPVRRGPRIASRTTTAQRIAQMQPVRRSAHRIPYNDRASPSAVRASSWFRFVWFVELFFLKFNI